MIELRHLKTLVSLARTHSVKLSAAELSMTQSALSHQLKTLEDHLGQRLFERKTQPLVWTRAGQTLLQLAEEVLPRVAKAEQTLAALHTGEAGRLYIGVDCHTCFDWLLPLLSDYQTRWPSVDLDVRSALGDAPIQALLNRQVDLLITSDPVNCSENAGSSRALRFVPLFEYELVVCLSPDHPLAGHDWLTPQALAQTTLITYPAPTWKLDVFSRFLLPAKVQPSSVRYSELTLMMLQQVDAGRGVCVLPRWLLAEQTAFSHLVLRPLSATGLWSKLYAGVAADQADQPFVIDFIERAADTMQPEAPSP
ncbi:LysR family transcriptional regulator [Thiomicrospira sp. WB1]|uniref:LysR family transcriptional regulator n=1 Tax=Thiomicrospira sp. WB1 TaxID=1685380 RepID=UPI000748F4B5|nr:LysR family transcriptional regulator [Thiomicrospira sp. WB1]KUJ72368.1 LysR family transcriptional regulator [Thiomicrospira sp. WB1]